MSEPGLTPKAFWEPVKRISMFMASKSGVFAQCGGHAVNDEHGIGIVFHQFAQFFRELLARGRIHGRRGAQA